MGEAGGTEHVPWRHPKARFFGAPPRFFAQEQRNGVELAVGGGASGQENGAHVQSERQGGLVFAFCVCADTLGGGRWPVLRFDPISLVLAQRNGVEPPKKSAFLPRWLHHSRERFCLSCRYSSSPDLGRRLGGYLSGCLRRGRTGFVMAALRGWSIARASLSLSASAHRQKRVSLGLHPVSLGKSKEMGWNGQQEGGTSAQRNGAHAQGKNLIEASGSLLYDKG